MRADVDGAQRPARSGLAKLRKFVTTWPSASVSSRMPCTYGLKSAGSALEIQQPAVAVDRGQAVAEFVRDAGGQLAEPGEAVLQPQLLFEIDDFAEIGEQADRAVREARAVADRRHGDAEVRRARRRAIHLHRAPDDRPPGRRGIRR